MHRLRTFEPADTDPERLGRCRNLKAISQGPEQFHSREVGKNKRLVVENEKKGGERMVPSLFPFAKLLPQTLRGKHGATCNDIS